MHLQETNKKRKNEKYEHLTAYLSISTARELSLTLILWLGGVVVSVVLMLFQFCASSLLSLSICFPV